MNPRQVIVLWIIAVALGLAVALVKISQQAARDTATQRAPGETVFEDFPAAGVASVTLSDAGGEITIRRENGAWVVADRDDYPARASNVLAILRTLGELKVAQATEAGPSFAPHFGMDEGATTPEERGITASFADGQGAEIASFSIGRMLDSGGRFVRNHDDESGFYTVSDMLHMFDRDPARWLEDGFVRPEKISSVRVAPAADPDAPFWRVVRDSEDDDFRLADGAPGETLESSASDGFKRLMGFARFQDVVPAAEVEARTADSPAPRVATIGTFEGFTYTITIAPAVPGEPVDDPDAPPASTDDQLITVAVEAELPAERKADPEESEEEAAELDAAFAERHEELTAKLEKEQGFAGRTFLVSKSVVQPLLQDRDEITTGPPEPGEPSDPAAATSPPAPPVQPPAGGGTSVTTPPIEIPVPSENDR